MVRLHKTKRLGHCRYFPWSPQVHPRVPRVPKGLGQVRSVLLLITSFAGQKRTADWSDSCAVGSNAETATGMSTFSSWTCCTRIYHCFNIIESPFSQHKNINGDCPFFREEVGWAGSFLAGEWHKEWVSGNNQMPRNQVHCIPGAKWTEHQVMSVVKKHTECIWRSLGMSEWLWVELGGFQNAQSVKSQLKESNSERCFQFFTFKIKNGVWHD